MSRTLGDMNCEQTEKLIVDHLDGELSEGDAELFEHHLAQCHRCRLRYERAEACVRQVAVALQPSEQFRARVMAAVREVAAGGEASTAPREARPLAPVGRPSWRLWLSRPAAAMAAAALVVAALAIGLWLLRPTGPGEPRPPRDHIVTPAPTTGPGQRVQSAGIPLEAKRSEERPTEIAEKPLTGARVALASAGFGLVDTVSGEASIKRETAEQWHPATEGDALRPGDALRTGPDSSLLAKFRDGSSLDLAADTELILDAESEGAKRPIKAKLTLGNILAVITPGSGVFEVETALAVASVQGTQFGLQATERKAVLTVLEGKVAFWNDLGSVTAKAMERSVAVPGHAPTAPHHATGLVRGTWMRRPALMAGGGLAVDDRLHSSDEVDEIRHRLAEGEESPELLARAVGALWWYRRPGCGLRTSVECAREVAARPVGLTELRRGDLGIVPPLSKEEGVTGLPIFYVVRGSPAEGGGVQEDDTILSVNGQRIEAEADFMDSLWRVGAGATVQMVFRRGEDEQTVTMTTTTAAPTEQELALLAGLRLLRNEPDDIRGRMVVANARACVDDFEGARREYEAILARHPDNAVAINNLGVLRKVQMQYARALGHFGRATELSPDSEAAWLNMAELYYRSGMWREELAVVERLVTRNPAFERASAWLAGALLHMPQASRDVDGVLRSVQHLAERHPREPTIASALADALLQVGRARAAAVAARRAIELGGSSTHWPRITLARTQEPEEAMRTLQEALDFWIRLRDIGIYPGVGYEHARRGLTPPPRASLERAIRLDPGNRTGYAAYLHLWHGGDLCDRGELEKGLEFCLKAAEFEPEWASPWKRAGEMADAAGDPEKAAQYHGRAVDIGSRYGGSNPDNLAVALHSAAFLARRARQLGDTEAEERYDALALDAVQQAEALAQEGAPELYLALAREYYMRRHDYRAAKEAYEKAALLAPELNMTLAKEYYLPRQEYQAAKEAYLEALHLGPRDVLWSLVWATKAFGMAGRHEDALDIYAAIFAQEPDAVDPQDLGLAVFLLVEASRKYMPDGDAPLAVLAPLLDRLQDSSFVRTAIAGVYLRRGDWETALVELEAATGGAAVESAYFWQLKAEAELAAGREDEALAAALKGVEVAGPKEELPIEQQISSILRQLDPAAGAEAVRRRMAAGPGPKALHRALAQLLEASGDMKGTEETLKELARRNPAGGIAVLARWYLNHGRPEDGENMARQGLVRYPAGTTRHAWLQRLLASALAGQGRWDEAIEHACLSLQAVEGAPGSASRTICDSSGLLKKAVGRGVTAAQMARIRDAVASCRQAIDRKAVPELSPEAEANFSALVERLHALAPGPEAPPSRQETRAPPPKQGGDAEGNDRQRK